MVESKEIKGANEGDEGLYFMLDGMDSAALAHVAGSQSQIIREAAGIVAECARRLYRIAEGIA